MVQELSSQTGHESGRLHTFTLPTGEKRMSGAEFGKLIHTIIGLNSDHTQ
jgi:hypothetical protein